MSPRRSGSTRPRPFPDPDPGKNATPEGRVRARVGSPGASQLGESYGQVISWRTLLGPELWKRCSAHRSAPDYGSEGWRFDSLPARWRANLIGLLAHDSEARCRRSQLAGEGARMTSNLMSPPVASQ